MMISSQFARVVKGVDLRSTARKCAWVRTPQLTQEFFTNDTFADGHTKSNAPDLFRPPKLSGLGPGQY